MKLTRYENNDALNTVNLIFLSFGIK